MNNLVVFGIGGESDIAYTQAVCDSLKIKPSPFEQKYFEDGESKPRSIDNVRGKDVYVICSLYDNASLSLSQKIVNLQWFVGSLKDASARRITLICPYMAYARQDRKTESRAPITTKYVSQVWEALGVDRFLTVDVHSLAAFQNAFRIPADNLDSVRLFTDFLCGDLTKIRDNLVVLSPDIGGMTRNAAIQQALEKRLGVCIPLAVFDKRRVNGEVKGSRIIGDVKGKQVIIFDDLISTGSTISKSYDAVEAAGGEVYAVCATHGLFTGDAEKNLARVKRLVITDTLPPWRLDLKDSVKCWNDRLHIVSTTGLIAEAIRRTHEEGGSISSLLEV